MRLTKILICFVVLLLAAQAVFAVWMGRGEVTGEVIESQSNGNRTVFRLTVSRQKIEQGAELGSPNKFGFAGADRAQITAGDIVKLRVNSSDGDIIRVEQLEFTENKPGAVEEKTNYVWRIVPLIAVAAVVIFLLMRRKSSGRKS